jgi:type III secretion protein R
MAAIITESAHPSWYLVFTFTLALIPLILGTTTSYLKISLALGVLRNGFGAQQVPSNTVIMVLALVLSLFIMQPTLEQVVENLTTLPQTKVTTAPTIEQLRLYAQALLPWRQFIEQHAGQREILILNEFSQARRERTAEQSKPITEQSEASIRVLIPAFVLTELKEGLMIGFVLLLPFLIIDLVIANILAGLGMYMMSPTIISLPLKLLLFVSVDGWLLMSKGFIASYGGSA